MELTTWHGEAAINQVMGIGHTTILSDVAGSANPGLQSLKLHSRSREVAIGGQKQLWPSLSGDV